MSVEAIQQSCDVFFYQLVLKVGLDKLYDIQQADLDLANLPI